MKSLVIIITSVVCFCGTQVYAQFDFTPDSLTTTTESFNKPFPTVWKAIRRVIKEKGCAVESEKQSFDDTTETYKGNMRSEACVLVIGEDSTRDVMMQFGKVPLIRGGVWVAGRAQYNFKVRDMPDKSVQVIMTVELSGNENYITSQVHFWNSNGILDKEMMDRLKAALESTPEKK